jgi:T5SS/PEP-CTERM-associated repeat protein
MLNGGLICRALCLILFVWLVMLALPAKAFADPIITFTSSDLGDGLTAYTFTVDGNDGEQASFFLTGLTFEGVFGGIIQQQQASGTDVHRESVAILYEQFDPDYDLAHDTWGYDTILVDFRTFAEGANATGEPTFIVAGGTGAGSAYETANIAHIVSTGHVAYSGTVSRLGVNHTVSGNTFDAPAEDLTWTNGSGDFQWDSSSDNWEAAGEPAQFRPNFNVTFADIGAGTVAYHSLTVGTVQFNNSVGHDYYFVAEGTGPLDTLSTGHVTKEGGGLVELVNGGHAFGNVTVTAGTLRLRSTPADDAAQACEALLVSVEGGTMELVDGVELQSNGMTLGPTGGTTGAGVIDGSAWMNDGHTATVGHSGQSSLAIRNGGSLTCSRGYIARSVGSSGSVTIQGEGSNWTTSASMYVGGNETADGGSAHLTIDGGTLAVGRSVDDEEQVHHTGTLRVRAQGSIDLLGGEIRTGGLIVAPTGQLTHRDGTLHIEGGTFNPGTTNHVIDGIFDEDRPIVELVGGATGSLTGRVTAGAFRQGELYLTDGGTLNSASGYIGRYTGSTGIVQVSGATSKWTLSQNLYVASAGQATVTLTDSGAIDVGGTLSIGALGAIIVDGGMIEMAALDDPHAGLTWNSGTIRFTGALAIASGQMFGDNVQLTAGRRLAVGETLTINDDGAVVLDGGAMEIADLVDTSDHLQWISGELAFTGNLTIGSAGPLGEALVIGSDRTLTAGGTLTVETGSTLALGGGTLAAKTIAPGSSDQIGTLGGSLRFNTFQGTVINDGATLSPGYALEDQIAGGSMTGDLFQNAEATLKIDVAGGTTPEADLMAVTGTATLDGTLMFNLSGDESLEIGQSMTILTATGITGRFNQIGGLHVGDGVALALIYDTTELRIEAALPGDADRDGAVNEADLAWLADGWKQTPAAGDPYTWSTGDFTGDGLVDEADLAWLADGWKQTPPVVVLPEPLSILILCSGLFCDRRGRDRRKLRLIAY